MAKRSDRPLRFGPASIHLRSERAGTPFPALSLHDTQLQFPSSVWTFTFSSHNIALIKWQHQMDILRFQGEELRVG